MRITETVVHAAAPARTFAMLTDPAYQQERCARSGALENEAVVEVEPETGATLVITRRRMPTDGFPDFTRPFVGDALEVVETVRWGAAADHADDEREGAMQIDVPGTPVRFIGGVHLRRSPGGTDHVVDGDLEANIPFLGSRIEAAIAPMITEIVRVEEQVGRDWLARG